MKNMLTGLLALVFVANAACSQTPDRILPPDVESRIKQVEEHLAARFMMQGKAPYTLKDRMAHYHVNGLSIAVIRNYHIDWARGYGWADSAEQRPVTVQTLFQAASISKSLNAVGVLLLAQEGKLDPYADINNYLTSWKFPYDSLSKGKKITVANLLSHTGGLNQHGFPGYSKGDTLPTLEQVLDGKRPANTGAVRSMYEPGVKSEYSGGGTTISMVMVQDITHEPYDRYMKEKVLDPLGMTASFYTQPAPASKASILATAYYVDGKEVKGKYHIYPEEAPAGLWTNPTDLARYIIETQLAYQGKSAKVLDQQYTKLRLTPYIDRSAALGVFIQKIGDGTYFQHGGANEGFRSQYYGSLEGGDGVVVMVNSDNGAIMQEVINSVATVYGWKDFYKPEYKNFLDMAPGQLQAYEGKYKYRGPRDLALQVTPESGHLVFKQLWDGQQSTFYPESDSSFFSMDWGFGIRFAKAADGSIAYVSAFDRDYFDKVKP
jgi:CubicO group peptidase (beta-lactamase class C family)